MGAIELRHQRLIIHFKCLVWTVLIGATEPKRGTRRHKTCYVMARQPAVHAW